MAYQHKRIKLTKQQVKTFFYGQTSYGNNVDLTQILLNANLFPTTNLDANGRPVTVWDTPIEVIGKGNSFYIKLLDLDETPCTYLLPLDFANDSDFVMAGEAGGVGDVADLGIVGTVGVVPSPLDADVACDLAGNHIGFQFE